MAILDASVIIGNDSLRRDEPSLYPRNFRRRYAGEGRPPEPKVFHL